MVIWTEYLTSIASALGTSATEAGMIFSLIFTIGLLLVAVIATKGKKPEITMSLSSFFSTVFFTFIGWYPLWIGSVMALVLALMFAMFISGKF